MSPMPFFGEICALLTAVCWSGSSMVFAAATARVGSVLVNISRLVFALGFLAIVLLLLPLSRTITLEQAGFLGASGIVGLAIGDSFLFRAYLSIGPRLSMLVMSIAPAISAVLAYGVLDERLSPLGIIGVAVTVTGVVLVVYDRGPGSLRAAPGVLSGLLFAGIAAVGQGVGLIFAKLAFRIGPIDGFVAAAVRIGSSLVVLLPLMIVLGRLTHPIKTYAGDRRALGLTALGLCSAPFLGSRSVSSPLHIPRSASPRPSWQRFPSSCFRLSISFTRNNSAGKAIAGAFVAVGGVALLFLR